MHPGPLTLTDGEMLRASNDLKSPNPLQPGSEYLRIAIKAELQDTKNEIKELARASQSQVHGLYSVDLSLSLIPCCAWL